MKREYAELYEARDTNNPNPTPHDLRAKLLEMQQSRDPHAPRVYSIRRLRTIIACGNAGLYDKLT
jgi:hypothetical protein